MITINVRRCSRLDDHTPHEWFGRHHPEDPQARPGRLDYWCVGSTTIEGGSRQPVTYCENCGKNL